MKNQPTGIVYTTIARDGEVLVEQINRSPQFAHSGNFMQVIHILLPKLPKEGRNTFHYDRLVIHCWVLICRTFDISVMNNGSIMFIAMSYNSVSIPLVFQYLQAVNDEFTTIYG